MSFSTLKFLGASVRGVQTSIAWDTGGSSQLNVLLAEDAADGDDFAPGEVGGPVHFTAGSMSFSGLLQRYTERAGTDGYPTYEVVVTDPREILEGTQVILGGYAGSVGAVANLQNPYGAWESLAFGGAMSDESGMPWAKVVASLNSLCNQPDQLAYGGPLRYRSFAYGLDLSQMPTTSPYYRVGPALSLSLLELITQVCDDHGSNFFVELAGNVIRVRTISRRAQPQLATLASVVSSGRGVNLLRSEVGVEARNETTSAFLFGGEVRVLHTTASLASYWGNDVNGSPILGTPFRLDLIDPAIHVNLEGGITPDSLFVTTTAFADSPRWPEFLSNADGGFTPFELKLGSEIIRVEQILAVNNTLWRVSRGRYDTAAGTFPQTTRAYLNYSSIQCERMALNATPVLDILGAVAYDTTTFELRLAKHRLESWAAYLQHFRPDVASLIGLLPPLKNKGGAGRKLPLDLVNDGVEFAQAANALVGVSADAWAKTQRFYDWLRGYADEYMGRKFAVSLPHILHAQNPETLRIGTSYEVDEAGWLEEGATPLGLSVLNQDVFKAQDGRFRAFAVYTNPLGADFSLVSPESTVLEDNEFYTAVEVDPNIVYTPSPAAVVTIPSPLFDQATDHAGSHDVVRATLQLPEDRAQAILTAAAHANVGVKVSPAHRSPASVAIPLKSNIATYGPWYLAGANGKVRVEQDQGLVPWNYGGYTLMTAIAQARVLEATANATVVEAGVIEKAGLPEASLGDTLQSGGPNVTGIQLDFSDRGVSTRYSFSTYTPFNRGGIFSRANQERLRRLSLTASALRKSMRAAVRGGAAFLAQVADGRRAQREFMQNAPKVARKQSPHEVLLAEGFRDDLTGEVRTGVSSLSFEEAVGGVHAETPADFRRTAAMSWSGLVRPISTRSTAAHPVMASYAPTVFSGGIDRSTLDPWKAANDVEVCSSRDAYQGLHTRYWGIDHYNARVIGLRGPLLMAGWGYDIEGRPVPGQDGAFSGGYLTSPQAWKAGPVDLLWDDRRGVWTSHDVLKGRTQASLAEGGSGSVVVYRDGSPQAWALTCHNWGGPSIPSGTDVHCLFNVLDKKWYALAAGSGGGSGGSSAVPPSSVYAFDTPEFLVATGVTPWVVSANWAASGIQPVAFGSSAGSGELFARYDHVHEHPVFASGNLHPEYARGPTGEAPSGYYVSYYGGNPLWTPPPAALVEKVAAVSGSCLQDAFLLSFRHEDGSNCGWASGIPVYLTANAVLPSGTRHPSFFTGLYRAGRPIYAKAPSVGVREVDGSPSFIYSDIVEVDQNDGLQLTEPSGGVARLDLLTTHSVVGTASGVRLVNDEFAPGGRKVYGTDGAGTRGWYDQPLYAVDPSGLAPYPGWAKFTKTYADFSTAGEHKDVTIYVGDSRTLLHGVVVKSREAFVGGGISQYVAYVGKPGEPQAYLTTADLYSAVGDLTFNMQSQFLFLGGGVNGNFGASGEVVVRGTAVGSTTDQAVSGVVDVYLLLSRLP